MSRPGLAASRSIDIIELLSLFPERGFTLSEIVRATQINIASCYAVLNLYPYNNGHILIVPNRHVAEISELKDREKLDWLADSFDRGFS